MKRCTRCETLLPLSRFHVDRKNSDGLKSRCKSCIQDPRNRKKLCTRCGVEHSLSNFSKNRKRKDGLALYCRPCLNRAQKHTRARRRNPCAAPGCKTLGATFRGYCNLHYRRVRQTGDPGSPEPLIRVKTNCKYPHCKRLNRTRGWCDYHYGRWFKTGSPNPPSKIRPKECLVPNCTRKHRARGLCLMHYTRWYKKGKIGPAGPRKKILGCSRPGCTRPHAAKGLCNTHYTAARRARLKEMAS